MRKDNAMLTPLTPLICFNLNRRGEMRKNNAMLTPLIANAMVRGSKRQQRSTLSCKERSMMNITYLFKRMTLGIVLASVPLVGGCGDNTLAWQEEVKLSDSRVITITQKRRYESVYTGSNSGNLPREYWLTFKLPEFGNKEITWHENLLPQVLNVHQGKLYVVGTPFTEVEFRQYGKPFPEYVPYRYEAGQWQRIAFNQIPEAIYDTNLWINTEPESNSKYISLTDKAMEMKDDRLRDHTKKISATYKSPH